jgi:hypothetical protein
MRVLILISLLSLLTACATERIVEKPVITEIETVRYIPIPPELLILRPTAAIPATITYGEALTLWSADRAIIAALLGQIEGIKVISDGHSGSE